MLSFVSNQQAYYADMSDPIIEYAAEIYQYVGDEIVVSWTIGEGLRNNNCIRCFFAMRSALVRQSRCVFQPIVDGISA